MLYANTKDVEVKDAHQRVNIAFIAGEKGVITKKAMLLEVFMAGFVVAVSCC